MPGDLNPHDEFLPLTEGMADPPIPAAARAIVVFGGSFDPPHIGHRRLAIAARDASGADWLLVVAAGQSPHKAASTLFDGEQRLDLVRAAFVGDARVSVSRMEVDRMKAEPARPSYTVETLRELRETLPTRVDLRLLIGADQALSLHRWREPRAIMELAEPLIMRRTGEAESAGSLAERIASNWVDGAGGVNAADWLGRIVDVPLVDASSTEARRLLESPEAAGRDARLRELLGDAVLERVRTLRGGR